MALTHTPSIGKDGKPQYRESNYNPSKGERERLMQILADFQVAETIMNNGYEEFGSNAENGEYLSLIDFQNQMQKRFNNNIPPTSNDPNQVKWRANTIRPLTRNKVISIVAHITASIIYPNVIAQNDKSEEDRNMSIVMKDAVEWAAEQMDYEDLFLKAVIDMCVNPAIILSLDYAKVMRKIKEITSRDKWEYKEVVDEAFSGFLGNIVPNDELYISNPYEPNIQRQDFLIKVKNITFDAAKSKYGEFDNFKYVQPGLRTYFDNENGVFYEDSDETLEGRLVQEAIYYNRSMDLEIPIINGILISKDPDRPLQRKDKRYPFAKSFYEMFNTRFFYGMPLVGKLRPDQDVIDTLYNMIIDGTLLELMPPTAVYGAEQVDSSVIVPGTITSFKSGYEQTRIEPIGTGRNLSAGMNILQKVENSGSESSQDLLQSGQQQAGGDRTKYEVVRLEQNAKTVLGLTGKMVASLVRDFGELLVGSIVQHMPIAEIGEITGDDVKLKFPTIFMPQRNVDGKMMSRKIEFTTEMPESEEEQRKLEFEMLAEEEEKEMSIIKVNPDAFRRMKYLLKVDPDFTDKATKFYKKIQLYDRAIANPLANQENVFRDFLLSAYIPGEEDKYIKKPEEQNQIMAEVEKRAGVPTNEAPVPQSPASQEEI